MTTMQEKERRIRRPTTYNNTKIYFIRFLSMHTRLWNDGKKGGGQLLERLKVTANRDVKH